MPRKPPGRLDRRRALAGRPERLPVVRLKQLPGGGIDVTIQLTPRPWLRWLKEPGKKIERTFSLDTIGVEVYQACDGKSDVKTIIRRFAAAHKLSVAEAEISVSTFLKTLMAKGLVAIAVDRAGK